MFWNKFLLKVSYNIELVGISDRLIHCQAHPCMKAIEYRGIQEKVIHSFFTVYIFLF